MNYIQRAFLSIKQRSSKSFILLLLMFILGNIISGAVAIQRAVQNTEQQMYQNIKAVSTVNIDYEKFMTLSEDERKNFKFLTEEQIKQIGTSSLVKYYDYSSKSYLSSNQIKTYKKDPKSNEGGMSLGFEVKGVEYPEIMDFQEGNGKLVEGRTFTKEEVQNGASSVVISQKVAEINNLKVGDTVKLKNDAYSQEGTGLQSSEAPKPIATEEKEVTVIGIYETKKEANKKANSAMDFMDEMKENVVYATNKFIGAVDKFKQEAQLKANSAAKKDATLYQPFFVLNNAQDLEKFKAETATVLPSAYSISDSSDQLKSITGPLKSIKWIASLVLYVGIGATLVILSLLITLFLKDRKHEIGIYIALGERKIRVMLQILIEVMVVAIVAISLSLFSGNLIAQGISSTMLKNQMVSQQESGQEGMLMGPGGADLSSYASDVDAEKVMESYSVKLDGMFIVGFYVLGIFVTGLSTVIPIVYVMRLNPKKILL